MSVQTPFDFSVGEDTRETTIMDLIMPKKQVATADSDSEVDAFRKLLNKSKSKLSRSSSRRTKNMDSFCVNRGTNADM